MAPLMGPCPSEPDRTLGVALRRSPFLIPVFDRSWSPALSSPTVPSVSLPSLSLPHPRLHMGPRPSNPDRTLGVARVTLPRSRSPLLILCPPVMLAIMVRRGKATVVKAKGRLVEGGEVATTLEVLEEGDSVLVIRGGGWAGPVAKESFR